MHQSNKLIIKEHLSNLFSLESKLSQNVFQDIHIYMDALLAISHNCSPIALSSLKPGIVRNENSPLSSVLYDKKSALCSQLHILYI